jgi:asparagine synthase (glutamine-hydrolysing)
VDVEEVYSEAIEVWDECRGASLVEQTLQFYTRMYLQDDILTKVDRTSMMHGLEVRSPFLDRDLVELVRRIPTNLKLRRGRTKHVLREAVAPLLPPEIIQRPKKGFGMPIAQWLREGGLDFPAHPGAEPSSPQTAEFLARRLTEHQTGRADHRLYLFTQWVWDRHRSQADNS